MLITTNWLVLLGCYIILCTTRNEGRDILKEAIKAFLSERKAGWIKKKIAAGITPEDMISIEQEAHDLYSPERWLPDAAKRAGQLSLVSHPGKFSHPDAKISPLIAGGQREADGFLRTGNTDAKLDVFGNAATMDVFKFLSLVLDDGQTILAHLERDTDIIQHALHISNMAFNELRAGFLSIKKNTATSSITSDCVKQVYFPVADGYHLLSVLTPSGLMFELRNRIQNIRFSEEIKIARDNKHKNVHNEAGFDELYDLSMIGYGGTKPQNISVLNSTYGGKSWLLPSLPPNLSGRNIRLPNNDFFISNLRVKNFKEGFYEIHKLFKNKNNNKNIRDDLARAIQLIIDNIIEQMWTVRLADPGWSVDTKLPSYQKIWLDESRKEGRYTDEGWLDLVCRDFARWFIMSYEKLLGKKAIMLDDIYLRNLERIMKQHEEDLL